MSILDSLLVGVIGISVVFVVLVGLILLLRLQSALVSRFTPKKAVAVPKAAAEIPSVEPAPAEESKPSPVAATAISPSPRSSGVRMRGDGQFTVMIDNVSYDVKMEEEGAPAASEPVRSAPVKTVAQPKPAAPVSAPKPAPQPQKAPQPKKAPAPSTGGKELVPAPVPGTVLDIRVTPGASVRRGDILVILEAMKMENEIVATKDGTVSQVLTTKGATVEAGAPLVEIQ